MLLYIFFVLRRYILDLAELLVVGILERHMNGVFIFD